MSKSFKPVASTNVAFSCHQISVQCTGNINKNMYIDEDFMVHVHVYLFLMSLDPVPCFILTITENLTNPVPKYVGEMENRRFYET